jgi:hypothetical protein
MGKVVLGAFAGYVVTAVLVFFTDIVIGGVLHGGRDTFTVVNLAIALPYALIGGYLAGRIAPGKELAAGIGLAAIVISMSVVTLLVDPGKQPLWYGMALLALMVAGAMAGALLRRRVAHETTVAGKVG